MDLSSKMNLSKAIMDRTAKIYIAGHRGMVGSAIQRRLLEGGYQNIIVRTSAELDLRNQQAVNTFFALEKPEYVFLAAAKVGGILANNTFRAEFIYDNLMIEANIIHASYLNKVKKLQFLGSSCIYPALAPQPLKEEYLLSGFLESTNQPYAIAKISGIELCNAYRDQYGCDFISIMPTNLYGPNDNYDANNSHVLPALLRKFIEAKRNNTSFIEIWGDGTPRREFLHVDDLADAAVYLMNIYSGGQFINVGIGKDISIAELAILIREIVSTRTEIRFNPGMPNGVPRKVMDISRLQALGWAPVRDLVSGITSVYNEIKDRSWN
jgi:GDP-L-fucose synthase